MSTATIAPDRPDSYAGPRCQTCGGPCWLWKGSVHGYTCTACLTDYLDASAARGAERDRADRAQTLRRVFGHDTPTHSEDRRRDGGGPALCTAPRPGVGH
ncbi:hypothetical protein KQR54_05605 [Mycobacterium gordonae]|uniref:hypothetical protein n=1 Tax=Mycobacterium gordonae TaxID=1778 RepID=UPI002108FCDA|nr:hypothetical protein [Mycobacterium gordonae]MCQ4360626.1 hypothetical protein [Mycobacterium gordonae]